MNVSSVAVSGPIIAAVVAGVLALIGVAWNQYRARQDAQRKDFAQALTAVERYAELPYRVLRRQDSTPEARGRIAEFIHEVQQDLLFHKSWIRIQAPRVADVYDSLLRATREEAGSAITEAWNTKPSSKNEDMPFGMGLSFPRMAEERVKYVQAVSYELKFPPLRLIKDYIVPRVIELLNRKNSGHVSTFGVRNPQAQSTPGGSRQEGEDRAPSTVDGDPPSLPPALLPTIPGLLWFGTNEESVVELMLACLSPCESTREGIEEAAWEAYGKGRG